MLACDSILGVTQKLNAPQTEGRLSYKFVTSIYNIQDELSEIKKFLLSIRVHPTYVTIDDELVINLSIITSIFSCKS